MSKKPITKKGLNAITQVLGKYEQKYGFRATQYAAMKYLNRRKAESRLAREIAEREKDLRELKAKASGG